MKARLDELLAIEGYCENKDIAKRLIMAGLVIVDNKKIDKSGTIFDLSKIKEIRILNYKSKYVSRGGLKLEKAINIFNLDFKDKIVLDVGASTGGFTDCSLKHGARFVYSVDVGTNQLDWSLRNNQNVKSIENTHINLLTKNDIDNSNMDYIVVDVSFISIKSIIYDILKFMNDNTRLVILIKPQFEADKCYIDRGGIVKNTNIHIDIINNIIHNFSTIGLYIKGLDYSPITGAKGNIEYISLFDMKNEPIKINVDDIVDNGKILGGNK